MCYRPNKSIARALDRYYYGGGRVFRLTVTRIHQGFFFSFSPHREWAKKRRTPRHNQITFDDLSPLRSLRLHLVHIHIYYTAL